jgi:hypothetical protein
MPRRYAERDRESRARQRRRGVSIKSETDVAKKPSPRKEGKRGDMEAQQEWCGKVQSVPTTHCKSSGEC